MAVADWRDQKKRDAEPSEMISVRVPTRLKGRVQEIATGGNSTLAAAVRWGLEKFIEDNGAPPKKGAALFD